MKRIKLLSIIMIALAVFSISIASINLKNITKVQDFSDYQFVELSNEADDAEMTVGYIRYEFLASGVSIVYIDTVDKITGDPVAGCTAEITVPSTGKTYTEVTNSEGQAIFSGIPIGEVIVKIIRVPNDYVQSTALTQENKITIIENQIPEVAFHLTRKTINVYVTAKDSDEVLIKDIGFTLYDSSRNEVATLRTGTDGKCTFTNLSSGKYYLKQTYVPAGYRINDYEFTLNLNESISVSSTVMHELEEASLRLTIQEKDTEAPIKGVTVVLKKMNGTQVGQVVTGDDGIAKFTGLEGGKYVVSITNAPSKYELDESYEHIEIDIADNTPTTGNINLFKAGTQTDANLVLYAHDTDNNPIADVTFEVKDENGYTVGLFRTNSDGKTDPTLVKKGKYYATAILAPDAYTLDGIAREINVDANIVAGFTIAKKGVNVFELSFDAIDTSTGKGIKDYGIKLMDSNGDTIDQKYTDANGTVAFEVGKGTYNFVCFATPDGYTIDTTVRSVTVTDSDAGIRLNIAPIPKAATLTVVVKDNKGNAVKDAVVKITDTKNASNTKQVTTNTSGNAVFGNLALSKYKVEVVSFPAGYDYDGSIYSIELVMDGKIDITLTKRDAQNALKGDLNRDGKVNSTDSAWALKLFQEGNPSATELKIGDMDNNGKINSTDAALILTYFQNSIIEYVQI